MDHDHNEAVALHRWAVIAEAAAEGLTKSRTGRTGARRGKPDPCPP